MEPRGELADFGGEPKDVEENNDDLTGWIESGENLIFPSMIKAMRLVKAVSKDGYNPNQKYKFRGIDGVLDAVGPALREAGIFVTSEIVSISYRDTVTTGETPRPTREVTARIRYTFHAVDGSSITTEVAGESLDQSDKGTAKAFSVALRIALLQTLALPTQEPTTDDAGQYHTRSSSSLSSWERRHGWKLLVAVQPDVAAIMDFWPAIVEAGQVNAPTTGAEGDNPTWHEAVAEALARAVTATNSAEEGRALYNLLRPAGALHWMHEGQKIGDRLITRADEIKANQVKAFDHCMHLVTSASDMDALETAIVHTMADRTDGPLTQEQYDQIIEVAEERRHKLGQVLNVAESQFLPTVGAAWSEFVTACGTEAMDADQLDALLTGEGDTTPACEFGKEGVTRFIDAVRKSHRHDRSITAEQRTELLDRLSEHMALKGIVWHEPIK